MEELDHEAGEDQSSAIATVDRLDVESADGTSVAVWVDGDGPPLVLVHGSLTDHTTFGALVEEFGDTVTTFRMDRRGFGASGDGVEYTVEREFEDVAAVVDAVAGRTGAPVALFGHSYGATCAMGGATLTSNVAHLLLYEPSFGLRYDPGSIERIEAALAAGDRESAITAVLVDILDLSTEDVDELRAGPRWPVLLAGAATVAREARVEDGWVYRPGQFDGVTAPTVLLAGSESPPELRTATLRAAAAIPTARIAMLEGHAHLAYMTDPAMIATLVRRIIG